MERPPSRLASVAALGLAASLAACTSAPPAYPLASAPAVAEASQGPTGTAGEPAHSFRPLPLGAIDLGQVVHELVKQHQSGRHVVVAFWIPREYWRAALHAGGADAQIEPYMAVFEPYLLFLVAEAEVTRTGRYSYTSRADLRASLRLRTREGEALPPLPWSQVDPAMINLIESLRPVVAASIGDLGANLAPFVFPSSVPGAAGRPEPLGDPLRSSRLDLQLSDTSLVWALPLESLLQPKVCPVDGASFSGRYRFCPMHGVPLTSP